MLSTGRYPNELTTVSARAGEDHHHADLGLMTPNQVHYGQADDIHAARQRTLDHAFSNNPERFVTKSPEPPPEPTAVWINPPQNNAEPPSLN
jgi:hypothetical protein